jgi:hypothetical protein
MSPRWNLLAAIAVLALALMETLSGEALAGYGQSIDRADNPKNFWKAVALHYAISLFFWGRYLYQLFSK